MKLIVNSSSSKIQPQRSPLVMIRKDSMLYLLILPAFVLTLLFAYLPMPGILISFEDYDLFAGIFGSKWVGLKYIQQIFQLTAMQESILNTLKISTLTLVVGFSGSDRFCFTD